MTSKICCNFLKHPSVLEFNSFTNETKKWSRSKWKLNRVGYSINYLYYMALTGYIFESSAIYTCFWKLENLLRKLYTYRTYRYCWGLHTGKSVWLISGIQNQFSWTKIHNRKLMHIFKTRIIKLCLLQEPGVLIPLIWKKRK